MNNIRTIKGGVNLNGKVKVPGDKSISHRALIIGSIAKGETTIEGFLHSEDPLSTADCLRKLGVNIPEIKENEPFRISLGSFNPSRPNPEIVKGSFFFISGIFTPNFLRQSALQSGSSECKNPSIVVSPLAILPIIRAL